MYHEDIELSYRAWKAGLKVRFAPKAIVHHVGGHSTSRAFTPTQLRSFVRQNEYLTVWKNVTDTRLILEHLFWLLPRILVAAMKGDVGTLLGFWHALLRLPRALSARGEARRHHVIADKQVFERVGAIDFAPPVGKAHL